MKCCECKYWGIGDGTGISYDSGHVNDCNHPQIAGNQHPYYGACGDPTSMVIVAGLNKPQFIQTRRNFGCLLFERIE